MHALLKPQNSVLRSSGRNHANLDPGGGLLRRMDDIESLVEQGAPTLWKLCSGSKGENREDIDPKDDSEFPYDFILCPKSEGQYLSNHDWGVTQLFLFGQIWVGGHGDLLFLFSPLEYSKECCTAE